jgi:hypothetical protein
MTFPAYPCSTLSTADVVAYLSPYRQKGWEIYRGDSDGQFIVRLDDNLKLFIELVQDRWRVSTGLARNESLSVWAHPETTAELESAIQKGVYYATSGGRKLEWSSGPGTARFVAAQPASNLSRLVALVGGGEIVGVFDAYLDNKGLAALLDLATLGIRLSPQLRLITSTKMVQGAHGVPRLTQSYASIWRAEVGIAGGEFRHNPYTGHQRRFMLLSDRQSLILGPSVNNLGVNEAAHVESDATDLPFFEAEWLTATILTV